MKQGDLLGGLLFALAHYGAFLKTTAWAPNYVFPSLMDNTHIVGFTSQIILKPFSHFSYGIFQF
jgi:hypothetical protein